MMSKYILFLLFHSCLLIPLCLADETPSSLKCNDEERQALLTFKQHLIDSSGRLASWSGSNCCQWNGLSCDNHTGRIVKMDLRSPYPYTQQDNDWDPTNYQQTSLSGKINPSLLSLKQLDYLDLSWNDFKGIHIPNFLGKLTSLRYLNLSYSAFSGEIPHFLGNLSNLNYLALDNRYYSNDLYETLFSRNLNWLCGLSSLKYLNLGRVDLTRAGTSCFHYFNMLPSLIELHLSGSAILSSQLPLSFPTINFTSLSVLDMSEMVDFNSSLPIWFFNLTRLNTLDLHSNSYVGPIPNAISGFKNLEYLDLFANKLEGHVSQLIGDLCTLKTLNLALNIFEKEALQDVLNGLTDCSYTRLEHLNLAYNLVPENAPTSTKAVLEFPASLGELHKLQHLDLRGNTFYGPIPESIGNLSSLKVLLLGQNSLNGSIPESLGQLSQLVQLDLYENLFEGSLTDSHLINLTKLEYFDVGSLRPTHLIFNVTDDVIPSFKLSHLRIKNCLLDDAFLVWLRSQTELSLLTLSGTGISSIPQEWLLQVSSHIQRLDLSNNQIQGKLQFQSMFPWLIELNLSQNRFSGSIASNVAELMPILQILYLSDNHLEGTIPPSICEMKYMWLLSLRNNQLSGEFPQAWSSWSRMEILDVSNNNISGHMPNSLPSTLVTLKLSNNNFRGKIPSSLQHCIMLGRIDLGGNNLSGNLPSWIGSMVGLVIIQLRSNSLSGHIPQHLCNLLNLNILELAYNNFSGTIPKCLKKLGSGDSGNWDIIYQPYDDQTEVFSKGTELEYGIDRVNLVKSIDLSSNNLEGEIPEEICSLFGFITLNLSRNNLHGKIPTNNRNLSSLETLDLSHSHLLGEIPQSLASLSFLSYLNLSYNNFSGRIPSGGQLETFTNSSYEGNPFLCGAPLSKNCSRDNDEPNHRGNLSVQENDEDHDEKVGLYISIAVGFITGFWGVCGALLVKRSWRYAFFGFFDKIKERIIVATAGKVARLRGRSL